MDRLDVLEATKEFLFAVINGDLKEMTELKDAFYYSSFIDLNIHITNLPIAEEILKHINYPSESTDILNEYTNAIPEYILGCAVLQKDVNIVQFEINHFRPESISDHDATICLYHSNIDVFKVIVNNYSHTMINKKLFVGDNSDIQSIQEYRHMFDRYFTPIHILLWSLFDMSNHRNSYNKPYSYRQQQLEKISYLITEFHACLNGYSLKDRPLCYQLLMHKQFRLLSMCLDDGLLTFPQDIDEYIFRAIKAYNTEMVVYLLHNKSIKHIDFSTSDLGHDILLYKQIVGRMHPLYLNALTEVIVNGYFVFYGNHYKAINY